MARASPGIRCWPRRPRRAIRAALVAYAGRMAGSSMARCIVSPGAASASISMSRLGSISALDHDQRRRRPDLPEHARRGPPRPPPSGAMSVTNIRVRTTSVSANPPSARAPSMIVEDRPRLGRRCRPGAASARPARHPSCRPPSTRRRRRSPGCSRPRPPTARPTRSAGASASRRGASSPARRGPRGRARSPSSSPASSVVRGTIDSTSRYSAGRVVVAADRAEAVEARARPCPAVVLASDAPPVAASASSNPRRRGDGLGMLDEPAAALQLLHRPPARHRLELDRHVGHHGRVGDARGSSASAASSASRVDRPDVDLERAALGARRSAASRRR